jgi:hypothetical protein
MNEAKVTQRGSKTQNFRGDPNKPLRYHCIGTHVIQGGEGGLHHSVLLWKKKICTLVM